MTGARRPYGLGQPRHPALNVPCPHCHASSGAPCTIPATGRRLPSPHPSRLDAATEAAA